MASFKGKGHIKHAEAVTGVRLEPADLGDLDSGEVKRSRVIVETNHGDRAPVSVTNLSATDPRVSVAFETPDTVMVTVSTLTGPVDAAFDFQGDAE